MEKILLRRVFYGALLLGKRQCTKPIIEKLFQIESLVVMDPEGEELVCDTTEHGGIYPELKPGTVYTVADEKELEGSDDEEELTPPPFEERVRTARAMDAAKKELVKTLYVPKHKDLYTLNESFLVDSFKTFVKNLKTNPKTTKIEDVMKKESETNVFSFNIFTQDFCTKLVEEVENFEESGLPVTRPNSMNNYGAILDDIGFTEFFHQLREQYILPISSILYPGKWGGDSLDSHHAFVVQYKMSEDRSLGFHYDESEVTLNVCLGRQFTGGELYFRGLYDEQSTHNENFKFSHVVGRAIFHIGRHRHGALPITSGERYNLIVWFRSSAIQAQREAQHTCSCHHHHDHGHDHEHDDGSGYEQVYEEDERKHEHEHHHDHDHDHHDHSHEQKR